MCCALKTSQNAKVEQNLHFHANAYEISVGFRLETRKEREKPTQHLKECTIEWEPQTNRSVKTDWGKHRQHHNQVVNYETLITTINSLPLITHSMHLHWNTIRRGWNFSTGIASNGFFPSLFKQIWCSINWGKNVLLVFSPRMAKCVYSVFRSVDNERCTNKQNMIVLLLQNGTVLSLFQFNWIPHSLR